MSSFSRRSAVSAGIMLSGAALLSACSSTSESSPASAGAASGSADSSAQASGTSSASPVTSVSIPSASASTESNPSSLLMIVNKRRPFATKTWAPSDLVPFAGHQLRKEAAAAATAMMQAAQSAGVAVTVTSAYRSYDDQVTTYNHWVSQNGKAGADDVSARPGYSEHQSGLAVDFASPEGCLLQECYEDTSAGAWLAKNAHTYGFILRFPKDLKPVTGYAYEPWHFRYIGRENAAKYVSSGAKTFEEFTQTGAAPSYLGEE